MLTYRWPVDRPGDPAPVRRSYASGEFSQTVQLL